MSRLRRAKNLARRMANELLSRIGLGVVCKERLAWSWPGRVLTQTRDQSVVLDIDDAYGNCSMICHRVFPAAEYLLTEPLKEFAGFWEERVRGFNRTAFIPAAVTAQSGTLSLHVLRDYVGSTLLREGGRRRGQRTDWPGCGRDKAAQDATSGRKEIR